MKKSLYSIQEEHASFMNEIEAADGELTPEMLEALEINQSQLEGKSIAYLEVIGRNEEFNTRIDAEIKRLHALKKRNGNLIQRLRDTLLNAVLQFGGFEVGVVKFGTTSTKKIVVDIAAGDLPSKYKNVKISEEPNKIALREAINSGKVIKGVTLEETTRLKIN